jgi:NAD+ synthase
LYNEVVATGLTLNTSATFNTPARIRMATLYAVSGIVDGRVANTSNLSEDWVGYATKFGDAAGDFSPLSDLTVTEILKIGRELGLAPQFIDKVPIDGLSGKSDEDNLGFTYEVLDKYIREGICENYNAKEKIDRLHKMNLHKTNPMPTFQLND